MIKNDCPVCGFSISGLVEASKVLLGQMVRQDLLGLSYYSLELLEEHPDIWLDYAKDTVAYHLARVPDAIAEGDPIETGRELGRTMKVFNRQGDEFADFVSCGEDGLRGKPDEVRIRWRQKVWMPQGEADRIQHEYYGHNDN